MSKIAFYLDNSNIKDIDCSNICEGNPGLGGTQYLFFLTVYYLSKFGLDVILLTDYYQKLPKEIRNINIKDIKDSIDYCKKNNIDILVIRTIDDISIYEYISEKKINTITWSHNFITNAKTIKVISDNKFIKRNICVGKEQMDYYIDDKIYEKSDYVYNIFNSEIYNCIIENSTTKRNIVTYIGSIIPEKGFHVLAKQWKKVLKKVPDAELHIIGSGKLYNPSSKLGDLKIAEKEYEKSFSKYITDNSGKLLPSIHVHGVMGIEKLDIIKKSKVGICNPIKKPETFGLTALEFQASGVPVIAYKSSGYIETIDNNSTGYLINNSNLLYKYIIRLLSDSKLNEEFSLNGVKFVNKKFIINNECIKWENIFKDICNENNFIKREKLKNKMFKGKIIKFYYGKFTKKKIIGYTRIKYIIKNNIKQLLRGIL